ncbi:hypothetical protein HYH03_017144 [Edaphochlamys debaryana]|uniref:Uncharacterized protein n=1 Tax=Edaphochlamys debaryana TaxID=47281 RepID=A0A835XQ05_9CHLO|nr:hypothetical protein HYH03_017144 [Edaphochlamys debaryana]|eukprot:KAG2484054.1 hypothetical protein HYH03_017144 [Edaphochlamys debaryana]
MAAPSLNRATLLDVLRILPTAGREALPGLLRVGFNPVAFAGRGSPQFDHLDFVIENRQVHSVAAHSGTRSQWFHDLCALISNAVAPSRLLGPRLPRLHIEASIFTGDGATAETEPATRLLPRCAAVTYPSLTAGTSAQATMTMIQRLGLPKPLCWSVGVGVRTAVRLGRFSPPPQAAGLCGGAAAAGQPPPPPPPAPLDPSELVRRALSRMRRPVRPSSSDAGPTQIILSGRTVQRLLLDPPALRAWLERLRAEPCDAEGALMPAASGAGAEGGDEPFTSFRPLPGAGVMVLTCRPGKVWGDVVVDALSASAGSVTGGAGGGGGSGGGGSEQALESAVSVSQSTINRVCDAAAAAFLCGQPGADSCEGGGAGSGGSEVPDAGGTGTVLQALWDGAGLLEAGTSAGAPAASTSGGDGSGGIYSDLGPAGELDWVRWLLDTWEGLRTLPAEEPLGTPATGSVSGPQAAVMVQAGPGQDAPGPQPGPQQGEHAETVSLRLSCREIKLDVLSSLSAACFKPTDFVEVHSAVPLQPSLAKVALFPVAASARGFQRFRGLGFGLENGQLHSVEVKGGGSPRSYRNLAALLANAVLPSRLLGSQPARIASLQVQATIVASQGPAEPDPAAALLAGCDNIWCHKLVGGASTQAMYGVIQRLGLPEQLVWDAGPRARGGGGVAVRLRPHNPVPPPPAAGLARRGLEAANGKTPFPSRRTAAGGAAARWRAAAEAWNAVALAAVVPKPPSLGSVGGGAADSRGGGASGSGSAGGVGSAGVSRAGARATGGDGDGGGGGSDLSVEPATVSWDEAFPKVLQALWDGTVKPGASTSSGASAASTAAAAAAAEAATAAT